MGEAAPDPPSAQLYSKNIHYPVTLYCYSILIHYPDTYPVIISMGEALPPSAQLYIFNIHFH